MNLTNKNTPHEIQHNDLCDDINKIYPCNWLNYSENTRKIINHYDIPINSWFITITLNSKFYVKRARNQFLITKDKIKYFLKMFCKEFLIIPELTQKSNIHYHGYIIFNDNMNNNVDNKEYLETQMLCLIDVLKIIGLSKINTLPIIEVRRTRDYMLKDIEKTNLLINKTLSNETLKLSIKYNKKNNIINDLKDELINHNDINRKVLIIDFNLD